MSDDSNPWGSGPPKKRPDKRERERMRAQGTRPPPRVDRDLTQAQRDRNRETARPASERDDPEFRRPSKREELRVFGVNACRAVFEHRPGAIRKAYLLQSRVPEFRDTLAALARNRIGYRIVENEDLAKLTQSTHHEGVCFEVLRAPVLPLDDFLASQRERVKPSLVIVLDGVGNPHNFGAVLRSAAHFGVDAILLPKDSTLGLTGAACRVAEGGAEAVPLVDAGELPVALASLARAGYATAATVVRDGTDLYRSALPKRLALVFGAETSGISPAAESTVTRRLLIPGTGAVESLNIAAAVAIVTAEWWRQSHDVRK